MTSPQSCAEYTILLLLLLTGTLFGLFLVVPSEVESVASSSVEAAEPAVESSSDCAWSWNYDTDVEGAARLQASLEADGFTGVQVSVSTFGETCNPSNPDAEGYSLVMDSSPQITLPLTDSALLQDDAALGDMIAQILPTIDNAGLTTPREIVITFSADGESREWRAMSVDVDRTLSGEAMFAAGTGIPE